MRGSRWAVAGGRRGTIAAASVSICRICIDSVVAPRGDYGMNARRINSNLGATLTARGRNRRFLDRPIKHAGVLAERAARGLAAVEHVAAAIDRQLEPVRAGEGRHLVEDQLVLKI